MVTRKRHPPADPHQPRPAAVRQTYPPRWLTVTVVLVLGAGSLVGGLLAESEVLVGAGIGLLATGALILLGFKVKSVNVAGLVSLEMNVGDAAGPAGDWVKQNYGDTITILQTADDRVFIEAPRVLQQLAVGRTLDRVDRTDIAAAVHEAIEGAPGTIEPSRVHPAAGAPPVLRIPLPWVHRPGDKVPCSGIYDVVDDHGRYLNHQRAVTQVGSDSHVFPDIDDRRAAGYVLRVAPINQGAWQPTFHPGQRVPWDGIYDVLDGNGHWVGTQKVCVAGTPFPPFMLAVEPAPQSYALHHRAVEAGQCPGHQRGGGDVSSGAVAASDHSDGGDVDDVAINLGGGTAEIGGEIAGSEPGGW